METSAAYKRLEHLILAFEGKVAFITKRRGRMFVELKSAYAISIVHSGHGYSDSESAYEVAVFRPNGEWVDLEGYGMRTSVLGWAGIEKVAELFAKYS